MRKERRSRSPLWARLGADQLEPLSKRSVAEQSVKSTLTTSFCCSAVPSPSPTSLGTHRESQNPAKCPESDPGPISTPSIHAPVDDTKTPQPPFPAQFTPSRGPALSLDCRLNAADETTIIEACCELQINFPAPRRLSPPDGYETITFLNVYPINPTTASSKLRILSSPKLSIDRWL